MRGARMISPKTLKLKHFSTQKIAISPPRRVGWFVNLYCLLSERQTALAGAARTHAHAPGHDATMTTPIRVISAPAPKRRINLLSQPQGPATGKMHSLTGTP
jgi:hypothetical protein